MHPPTPARPSRAFTSRPRAAALVPFLALLAVFGTAIGAAPAAHAQNQVIKLATLVPDGSVWDRALRTAGAEWSQSTQGRVSLRIYPGGVAGDEPDVVRKMRIGQVQAAALTVAGLAEIDPAFKVFGIPMFFDSYPELRAVLDKMTPMLKQRLEAKGFILLNWGHGGWVHVFGKQPLSSTADLKKLKLWVGIGDDQMTALWKKNGYQPVAIPATDILTGLQSGMLDAIYTTPLAALSLQWFRTTPYMSDIGLAPLVGGTVISKTAWNKLSESDRATILASCLKVEKKLEADVPQQDDFSVAEMKKRGLKVSTSTPAQAAQWRQEAEQFAAQMRGAIVAPDVMDFARKERDAYRARATQK
jgi:TRAP-type C4-dicarboxylate transport system substrate-binding protein